MAKGKKSKKDLDSDEENSEEETVVEEKPKTKKDKKKKKAQDVEDLEKDMDDLELSDEKPEKPDKKEKKKKKKKKPDSDSDEDAPAVSKGGFGLLMADDLPSDDEDSMDEEEEVKKEETKQDKKKKKGKGGDDQEEKGNKKKKKKKKNADDDEDLDAMLAALRAEYNDEAPPPEAEGAFDGKEDKKAKKGKKKDTTEAEEAGFEVIDGDEEAGGTVKTAAQKKKEKRDRQKQKLAEDAKKGGDKAKVEKQDSVEKTTAKEEIKKEATPEGEEEGKDEEGEEKKGKKKKGKKEEEDKKKKKPNKAVLAAMQELLQKQKDEEERLEREADEAERLATEKEKEREEQKKKDDEKRAAKKEKERLKKAELKAAGKLLTPAQKLAKQRAEAMLEAMRAQGVDVPVPGEKRLRPGAKPRKRQTQKQAEEKEESPDVEKKEESPEGEKTPEKDPEKSPEKEEPADSWEAEDEIKDAWDAESDKEEEKVVEEAKPEPKEEVVEEEEDDDDDEEDSDDDEDESDEEDSTDEDSGEDSEEDLAEAEKKRKKAMERIQRRKEENEKNRTTDVLRAPVVCVLGHVDTGKTKILDKLRRTNVQDGEAGGITQQIGATNVPIAVIQEQCKMVPEFISNPLKLPGLLIIDTPGHESFSNLRDRGSSLCDIAILVVDIMHGLEPQTLESINLLVKKKTPFVVAINKIDRLYEWKANRHKDVREVLEMQPHNTQLEFKKRKDEVILGLAEQGLNAALFWENPDPADYISLIPTSAHSGDGMGNLMALLVQNSQTFLAKRLSYTEEMQATVLEVKAIGGFGTTIDVVLVNGRLKFGSTLVLAGTDGPIVTTVKALLTPSKMQDLRVKNQYIEHKELQAAQGVKIAAKELEKVIAGLSMRVAYHPDEVEILKEQASNDLKNALNAIKTKPLGVFVQASTLGSLEALLEFLKTSKIPYAGVRIGPVVRKDVMRASTMLEHEEKYAVILAFDVKVERDAQEMADREGVKIFQADIIYHLFDRFTEYQAELVRKNKEQFRSVAVFPCKLKVMPEHVYMSRDPIVCGVKVEAGTVKINTPICVPSKEFCYIGILTGIQHNNKDVDSARKGDEVCVKIESVPGDAPKMFGRHFDADDMLCSRISRESIDACKDYFRDELQKTDWQLMVELKKLFEIL